MKTVKLSAPEDAMQRRPAEVCLVCDMSGPHWSPELASAAGAALRPASAILGHVRVDDRSRLAAVVRAFQAAGVATLVADDPRLAAELAADGIHLSAGPDVVDRAAAAREALGKAAIVGVDAGGSRHDAMLVAEDGADYVAFSRDAGSDAGHAARDDLVAWWAEVFEVPVVALDVATPHEAAELADAGADFVAVTPPRQTSAAELRRWIEEFASAAAPSRIG